MRLSVNIDHFATLRQARESKDPDPIAAALLAELAGADGITVHLRQDRRHIQERDIYLLREVLRTRLNVEVAMTPDGLKVMKEARPDQVTLVPERAEELTTEGGLDLASQQTEVAEYIALYREAGIEVSLFINPEPEIVRLAGKLGPATVELNTAAYGQGSDKGSGDEELRRIAAAARQAAKLKLKVHAGHDLNYRNTGRLAAAVAEIAEVSIGHSIVARSALVGMERSVKDMLELIR
jgi:pyridoxine 5-phosphate synthase